VAIIAGLCPLEQNPQFYWGLFFTAIYFDYMYNEDYNIMEQEQRIVK